MKALCALVAASICCAVPVYAANPTCANISEGPNTARTGSTFFRNYDVQAGDQIRVTTSRNITTQVLGSAGALFSNTGTSSTYTVPSDNNNLRIQVNDPLLGVPAFTYAITCISAPSAAAPVSPVSPAGPAADTSDATQLATRRQQLVTAAAQATAQSQGFNVGQSIRNAITGVASSTKQPIRPMGNGGLYFQAPLSDPDGVAGLEAWASFSASEYDGTTDGSGLDLTFGVQRELSDLLIAGLVGSYGTLDLTSNGTNLDVEAFVAGPYFAYEHQNLTLNGYILYGQPDYDFGGGVTADASRLIYSLGLSGRFPKSRYIVSPFMNLSGFQEDIDAAGTLAAQDISQYALGVGSRVDFVTRGAFDPYVALGFDAWEFDNGTSRSDGVSPRLEAGFSMQTGAGRLSADFSAAEVSDDVDRYGISLRYDLRF